jgi:hypothetical protein
MFLGKYECKDLFFGRAINRNIRFRGLGMLSVVRSRCEAGLDM